MAKNGYQIGFFGALVLVVLRVLIGVQFLTAGIEKFDPSFTSAGFLRNAHGPLAEFYESHAPLPHNWDQNISAPLPAAEQYESERVYLDRDKDTDALVVAEKQARTKIDSVGHIPYPTDAYGDWAGQVADDWHTTMEEFQRLPGISEEQGEAAEQVFNESYYFLAHFIDDHRGDIAEYHHEAGRLEEMQSEAANGSPPFLDERIAAKESEVAALPRPWVAVVADREKAYYQSLTGLLTEEQTGLAGRVEEVLYPSTTLGQIDGVVKWFTLIVGLCLLFGLFTRLAAVAGAAFLVSVISTQPPWVEGIPANVQMIVGYQGIEFFALLLLALLGAGAWAGLDGLLWGRKAEK